MSNANSVRVVVDKDTVSRFASCQSATLNHLNKYETLTSMLNYVLSYSVVSSTISAVLTVLYRARVVAVDSPKSPQAVKKGYQLSVSALRKMDEWFNLLVLREGIDEFLGEYRTHNGKPGFWVVLYMLDYCANVSNLVLKELVVKPLNLGKKSSGPAEAAHEIQTDGVSSTGHTQPESLPHIKELAGTTRSLSQELHSKLQSDYIEPTRSKLQQEYIEPTKDKINGTREYVTEKYGEFIKPTYNSAYQTVYEKYEGNLTTSESVPRAIVSTGVDLGHMTLDKLKNGVAHGVDTVEPKAQGVAEEVNETAASMLQNAKNIANEAL
ncbi:LAME_0G05622g1_1 [Lachancea meyersii CBS 8951]|uniref:LAME_0G05622g1_1 n=1 Tax=Lachancea meyersii CBS 8951 TaxID=1266667 RepID=A0A1G4K797_9SACH|nr:LAME_0G05622g1_1 [Lachancea meyersii CBS 8951]